MRWPLVCIAVIVLALVVIFLLPASMISRWLPSSVNAEDYSGTVFHGAAGRVRINGRDCGALEWVLHPAALLRLTLAADIHWVKVGFVLDGLVEVQRHHLTAHRVRGGGPIESLIDFGVAPGWRGIATASIDEISGDFARLETAVGRIDVSDLSSDSFAAGSDLGGYELSFPSGSIGVDGSVEGTLADTGGPLELRAHMILSPTTRTGGLAGTLKERSDASVGLRNQLSSLAQLHARDANGYFPVDVEFNF